MSRLLEQVREAVRARRHSIRTEEAYIRWVREYILLCGDRIHHPPRSSHTMRTSHVVDFARRKEHESYRKAFERLVRDLKGGRGEVN